MKPTQRHFPALIRGSSLLLAIISLSLPLNAQEEKQVTAKKAAPIARTVIPEATLARLEAHTNLTYARYGERTLQLDLYRPKDTKKPLPAVVCIHGGGWFQGDRNSMRALAQALDAETCRPPAGLFSTLADEGERLGLVVDAAPLRALAGR